MKRTTENIINQKGELLGIFFCSIDKSWFNINQKCT